METVKVGFNLVVGTDPKAVKSAVERLLNSNYREVLKSKRQPFAGLRASYEMMRILVMNEQAKKVWAPNRAKMTILDKHSIQHSDLNWTGEN